MIHPLPFDAIDAAHLVLDLDEYTKLAEGPPPLPPGSGDEPPLADADGDRALADAPGDRAGEDP